MINNYIIDTLFVMNFQIKLLKQKDPMDEMRFRFLLHKDALELNGQKRQ